jgi:hypothetical protein
MRYRIPGFATVPVVALRVVRRSLLSLSAAALLSGLLMAAPSTAAASSQPLQVVAFPPGFNQFVSVNSGKCLDRKDRGSTNGTPIQQFSCTGAFNQGWTPGPNGEIIAEASNGGASNECLDAKGFGTSDGTPIQIFRCAGTANQRWFLGGVGGGKFAIVNVGASNAQGRLVGLDVVLGSTANGAKIQLWHLHPSPGSPVRQEQWHF